MKKSNPAALLPILVFLVLFVGMGIYTGDFYTVPAVVGFLIALITAFLQNRSLSFHNKIKVIASGMGDESIITMILVFIMAGAFSGIVSAAGGAKSAVHFGLSVIPSHFMVVGIFIVGCFISLSMGTSMGTIASLAPIAIEVSQQTDLSLPLCMGAVVCGAMFGDNLSMVSDTTIAAVKTQGCEMKDKFKQNFLIVLPAAVICIVIFIVLTWNVSYTPVQEHPYHIVQILPYLVVLVGALIGFNVFGVLLAGILMSAVVGIAMGSFTFVEMFSHLGNGIEGMFEISVISILVASVFHLIKENGGIQFIINAIKSHVKSQRGAEIGIASIAAAVDLCTANNTVAIVMAGPIAKEISEEYQISSKRTASLLDIFTSTVQGMIPYGAQLLSAATFASLSPLEIMPYLFYPILMCISAVLFILLRKNTEKKRSVKTASE